jgi:hypothetical protein
MMGAKPTLFFAGEATSADYPGTVHGAYSPVSEKPEISSAGPRLDATIHRRRAGLLQ